MGKKILIIDDNSNFLEYTKYILDCEGYETEVIDDPLKTEEYIDSFHPDLLIIDVYMPQRTGFDIIESFNNNHIYQDIPKIFVTGLNDDIEKAVALSSGVKEYIVKPFNFEKFCEVSYCV